MNANKEVIAERLMAKIGLNRTKAEEAVSAVFDIVCEEIVKGKNIMARDQFSLQLVKRKPKLVRDINAGKNFYAPERMVVKFVPSKKLKASISPIK